MRNAEVAQAIQAREAERRAERIASRTSRQVFWTEVMNDADAPMLARLRASELLARSEGDFLERHVVEGPPPMPQIIVNFRSPEDDAADDDDAES